MQWSTLQAKVHGLKLNNLFKDEFVEMLNNEFEDKKVDVVNIQIALRDNEFDKTSNCMKVNMITLSKMNFENILLGNVIVDVDNEDNFDKIKNILEGIGD